MATVFALCNCVKTTINQNIILMVTTKNIIITIGFIVTDSKVTDFPFHRVVVFIIVCNETVMSFTGVFENIRSI